MKQTITLEFEADKLTKMYVNKKLTSSSIMWQSSFNRYLATIKVNSNRQWNEIEFKGPITINKLILDGIDTKYFIHHGFTDYGRGNSGKFVKYYFKAPIWEWIIDWTTNDNSTFRTISKINQGFLPL